MGGNALGDSGARRVRLYPKSTLRRRLLEWAGLVTPRESFTSTG